jgi:hypothetical protein
VFKRGHHPPYDLMFGAPPDKDLHTIDQAANLVNNLQDMHNYARQHLNLTSDRMKIR